MKNQKGISLITLLIVVAIIIVAVFLIISKTSQNSDFNRKKDFIKEINESAVAYNLDVVKKNTIIKKYNKNAPDDLLFKEVKQIPLDTITSKNVDSKISLYQAEHEAVMEFNDTLLEYYKEIFK